MSVDLITFCCYKDIDRLHDPGEMEKLVNSHAYQFNNVYLVYQNCRGIKRRKLPDWVIPIESEDHPMILTEFGISLPQDDAEHYTHGPSAAHYWKWHVINHLIGLKVSQADYIVFSDCDCRIKSQPTSWIPEGLQLLQHQDILIVSPSDGGSMAERLLTHGVRLTQNVSQQLFLCNRERLKAVNFDVPWNWEFLAPGGPMQEYYYMLEGRLWRYMHHNQLYRAILPEQWRYWHYQW